MFNSDFRTMNEVRQKAWRMMVYFNSVEDAKKAQSMIVDLLYEIDMNSERYDFEHDVLKEIEKHGLKKTYLWSDYEEQIKKQEDEIFN